MKYFEPIFHVFYLGAVFYMSLKMIYAGKNNKLIKLFGVMGFTLGAGDSFHLIPRIYALLTTGLEAHAAALGIGKLVTSITMTLFYAILIRIWEIRFDIKEDKGIRVFAVQAPINVNPGDLIVQIEWLNSTGASIGIGLKLFIANNTTGKQISWLIYSDVTEIIPTNAKKARVIFSKSEGADNPNDVLDIDKIFMAKVGM